MLEQAAYLNYQQSILLEYNSLGVLTKFIMLKYFWKDLKFSILVKLQNKDFKLEIFIWIVKKTVIAEAKTNLWSQTTTKDINQHYLWGSRIAYTKNQCLPLVDLREEEPKIRAPEVSIFRFNNSKSFTRAQKKKKDCRRQKQQKKWGLEGSSLVNGVNTAKRGEVKGRKINNKNRNRPSRASRDWKDD